MFERSSPVAAIGAQVSGALTPLPRVIAAIVWGLRSMIDGDEHHFDVLVSLSILTSLSISRHVSNST